VSGGGQRHSKIPTIPERSRLNTSSDPVFSNRPAVISRRQKGTERIYSSRFRGRPRDRKVDSRPKRCAVAFFQESSP
jgi:hypothetical protein